MSFDTAEEEKTEKWAVRGAYVHTCMHVNPLNLRRCRRRRCSCCCDRSLGCRCQFSGDELMIQNETSYSWYSGGRERRCRFYFHFHFI